MQQVSTLTQVENLQNLITIDDLSYLKFFHHHVFQLIVKF